MIPKEILRKLRRIEIRTSRLVTETFAGNYQSVFKGRGMEFAEVREYQMGDDVRIIDWNVTSRMGHPFVKKFVEERELTVMLLFDASRSGEFGTRERMKRDLAVEIGATLAFSAIKNNDRVGLLIFTDEVEKYVPPKKGHEHVMRLIRDIYYYEARHAGTRIAAGLEFLNRVLRKRAVVFLISDFIDEGYDRLLRVASRRHDVIAVVVADPREQSLSHSGLVEVEDAESGRRLLIDTSNRRARDFFEEMADDSRRALTTKFREFGIDSIRVSTPDAYEAALLGFFKMRARKLRR